MELIERICRHASERPRSLAIRCADDGGDGAACTYAELARRVGGFAEVLRGALPKGAVILLKCANRPEFLVAYYGIQAAEMSVFPVPPDMALPELCRAAEVSSAAAILVASAARRPEMFSIEVADGFVKPALGLFRRSGDCATQPGSGLLLQSSGTTGEPKVVWRSGESLDAMAAMVAEAVGFSSADGVLMGLPLGHSYGGEHGVLGPAYAGAAVHACNGLNLGMIGRELASGRITILPGVPFLFEILAKASDVSATVGSLRQVYSAGAMLPKGVQEAFRGRFGVSIGQIYGATEVGSVTFGDGAMIAADPSSVGYPMRGVSLGVVDPGAADIRCKSPAGQEGEVTVFSPAMLSHLVGGQTSWKPGMAWLTGDLGRLSGRGALTLTGRLRLLIDVGGRKVNPIEVEQVIRQHPAVADCVVVGAWVSDTVARLRAVVECRRGESVDEQAIREFVAQQLTPYKVPRLVEFWPALPRTPLGKVLRREVETR